MSLRSLLAPPEPPPPKPGPDGKPPPQPELTGRIAVGIAGALLAAFLSNLNTRLTTFSQADLRGGFGLGLDDGSWVVTAYNVAEIAVVPITAWLASLISPRRAVATALCAQTLAGLLVPSAPSYTALIALRFIQGLGGGALIPLLLVTLLRTVPMHLRSWAFAAYALVTTLTPLISETLAGALVGALGFQGIFLQNLLPAPIALAMVLIGLPTEPAKFDGFARGDYFGMLTAALIAGCLSVAMGQGQRLDWFDNGLICGLFAAAALSAALFVWHSLAVAEPLVDLRLLTRRNLSLGLLMIVVFNFATFPTSTLLPQFGAQIHGFRELQVGALLLVVGITQIVMCPLAGWLVRVVDPRLVLTSGLALAAVGSRLATWIDADWVRGNFLGPLLIEASGQPLIMVALIMVTTSAIQPQEAISGSTLFNMTRTLGQSAGPAIVTAILTVRERVHSFYLTETLGLEPVAQARGAAATGLQAAAHAQATVMAFADAFGWLAVIAIGALLLVLPMHAPTVARHPPGKPA